MLTTNALDNKEDAKEKEAKYRAWIAQKTVCDKTYDLLEQLDPSIRAGNKEQARMDGVKNIIEVAISVAAAARFVGEVDKKRSTQAAQAHWISRRSTTEDIERRVFEMDHRITAYIL